MFVWLQIVGFNQVAALPTVLKNVSRPGREDLALGRLVPGYLQSFSFDINISPPGCNGAPNRTVYGSVKAVPLRHVSSMGLAQLKVTNEDSLRQGRLSFCSAKPCGGGVSFNSRAETVACSGSEHERLHHTRGSICLATPRTRRNLTALGLDETSSRLTTEERASPKKNKNKVNCLETEEHVSP